MVEDEKNSKWAGGPRGTIAPEIDFAHLSIIYLYISCFSSTSEGPRKLIFMGPNILNQLEGMCKKKDIYIYFTEADFLLFTASARSQRYVNKKHLL